MSGARDCGALLRRHLDPALEPRGWSFQEAAHAVENGERQLVVLYHADPDPFEALFPEYGARLRDSYDPEDPPTCYDLWLTFRRAAGRAWQDVEGQHLDDLLRDCGEAALAERVVVLSADPEADLAALALGLRLALDAQSG